MGLDATAFRDRFKGTPILRTKRRGLLRNVAVALGNWRSPAALPALESALQDPEPLIREHAAWAIKRRLKGFGHPALPVVEYVVRVAAAGSWIKRVHRLTVGG